VSSSMGMSKKLMVQDGQQAVLPLHAAAAAGDIRIVDSLLKMMPKVNEQYENLVITKTEIEEIQGRLPLMAQLLHHGTFQVLHLVVSINSEGGGGGVKSELAGNL
jgi:hypothetical protein